MPLALPPGPRLPRWAQTAAFILNSPRWIDLNRRRYGDVVTFRTVFDPCFVMVFDPALAKQVFRGPPEQLRAGEVNVPLGPIVGTHSVLVLDGARHLRERKLLLPPFHGARMRAYEEVMTAAADRAIDSWPAGRPFQPLASMRSLTLDVILRAVFGVDERPRLEQLGRRIQSMLYPGSSRLRMVALALSRGRIGRTSEVPLADRRAAVDELIYAEIAARRQAPDLATRDDVLSMLLQARDEQGEPMSDEELRDELVTLLVAGHETTATALSWALALLVRTPASLARLRESLVAGDRTYLEAVVKETLRMRPPIAGAGRFVRERPFELAGHTIPVGIEIKPSIVTIHRRPDLYPSPDAFRPERFVGDGAADSVAWLPFGGGIRRCLGASFASFEMAVVIRRVVERTELAPAGRGRGLRSAQAAG
jgi:cytochrome P450 family 135